MLPSLVMEISDVPAPTSTNAMFSIRNASGIATLIAAIGSNVILATSNPAKLQAEYSPSTTSSGKKVTMMSSEIRSALCPSKLEKISSFK